MKSRILALMLSAVLPSYAYAQGQLPAKSVWGNDSTGPALPRSIPYSALQSQFIFSCSQLPALTGDVTTSAGSCATAIANNAVSLAKLATQSPNTALVNATGGTAVPTAFPMPNCSTATSALFWTTNSGFGCHTITAGAIVSVTDPAYGAICSGSVADAAANTTAFTNALATGRSVFVPYCSLGYNFGANFVPMASNQTIVCENQATVLYGQGAKLFYISSLGPETKVEHCTVNMAGGVVGATAFLFKTSTGPVNGITLRNVRCLYTYHCYDDEGTNPVAFFTAERIYATQTYGLQFRLRNSNGFIRLRDIECDFTGEAGIGLVTWGCGDHANFIGIEVSGLTVATGVGVGTPVFVASNPAWKFSNGQAMWVNGSLFADHTAGDGILIDSVTYLWGDKIEGSLNLGTSVTISNSTDANLSNLICYGAVGQTGAAASKTGCDINNVTYSNFTNMYERNSTGLGIAVRGTSQNVNITNLIATANTGGGLAVQNSATNINIANGFVGGNTGTAYSNTSSGSVYANFISGGSQWPSTSAPGSPPSGNIAFWFDTTDARFHDKNASGTIGTTVQPITCTNQFASAILSTGGVNCRSVNLGLDITGTTLAINGGTGFASFAVGDLLYASTTTAFAKLADVAVGSVLVSGGINTAPAWSATPVVTRLGAGVTPVVALHAKGVGELTRLESSGAVGSGGTVYMRYDDAGGQQGYFGFAGVNNRFDIMPNTGNTLALGAGAAVAATFDTSQQMFLPVAPATDATKVDNTLCRDTTTGQIYRGSGASGICLGTSGRQFKNSIVDIVDGLDEITRLRPRNFFYNPGYGDDGYRLQYGFVADEVLGALPRIVGLDSDGRPNTVDMLAMTPIMVRAIQQITSRINALEQKGH